MATENEKKKWDSKDYLSKHKIHSMFEQLVSELVRYKPNSPMEYISLRVKGMEKGVTHHRPNLVLVCGGPLSGRGTQCALLVEKFGLTHLIIGDLVEKEIRAGSELGRQLHQFLKAGATVPADSILALLKQAIGEGAPASPPGGGTPAFLIDGFPRNLEEALLLERDICEVRFVLYLHCPDDVLRARLPLQCTSSTESALRLREFHTHVLPALEYFRVLGKLRTVNAAGSIKEVREQIEPLFSPPR